MNLYDNYILKNLREKIYFWDMIFNQEMQNFDEESILQFLKNVILNHNETLFCRMRALKEIICWTFLDKIKHRKTIAFLLDEMVDSNEELLECYRLKYLALFYQKEKQDIRNTFTKKCNEKNELIKVEAKYQLGLIMFFDANDIFDKREFLNTISEIQQIFYEVSFSEENRIDAKLLSLVCSYINSSFNFDLQSSIEIYQKIKELIFEGILFQIDDELSPVYLNIGQNISRIQDVIVKNPEIWIDYKNEFNKLCSDFYAISNFAYKDNDLFKLVSNKMNERIKKEVIEPVFKYNYKATLSKIDVILSENDIDEHMISFLQYLKGVLLSEDIKEINYHQKWFEENFPMLTEVDWNSFNSSLSQSNVSGAVYNLINAMERLTPVKVLNDIISSCIKLQANSMYRECTEDERNDYIRDLLSSKKYQLRDQTRQGLSQQGKASGEIDILILDNNMPYSLFEALNLNSLNTSYLNIHIDKIFKYDTLGHICNFLVSYVTCKDFGMFWAKYIDHIKRHNYPYSIEKIEDNVYDNYCYSNLKVVETTLIRNGKKTTLYHICVLIQI